MTLPTLEWNERGQLHTALWRSEGQALPRRVQVVDDHLSADQAWRLASEGTALLWRGDYHNARQLLQAMARRAQRKSSVLRADNAAQAFHLHRQAQSQRARNLAMVLVPLAGDYTIPLRRAPLVHAACTEAWGAAAGQPVVTPLRQLLGLIGAHEWRKNGVSIPALELAAQPASRARIYPHYGVFSPVRGEYVDLVAQAPLPVPCEQAMEIGVGTGVLSIVLARRGVPRVLASDLDPRALACAQDNLQRQGLAARVQLLQADLFPPGAADLVLCNPPWLPGRPSSALEQAVYDENSAMLRGYLAGLRTHLTPKGEGWLILSDLAEHLGLRSREQLLQWISQAGLHVLGRHDARPRHGKAFDAKDPLHAARAAEITSLWRLGAL